MESRAKAERIGNYEKAQSQRGRRKAAPFHIQLTIRYNGRDSEYRHQLWKEERNVGKTGALNPGNLENRFYIQEKEQIWKPANLQVISSWGEVLAKHQRKKNFQKSQDWKLSASERLIRRQIERPIWVSHLRICWLFYILISWIDKYQSETRTKLQTQLIHKPTYLSPISRLLGVLKKSCMVT